MLKNNLKVLLFHIVVSILFIVINEVGYLETIDDLNKLPIMLLSLLLCPSYTLFSFLLLKDMGTRSKNFFSTVSIIILGVLIWTVGFKITDYNHLYRANGDDGFVYEWWTYHDSIWQYFYNSFLPFYTLTLPVQIFMQLLGIGTNKNVMLFDVINLYLIFLPSLFFYIGILMRNRIKKHDQKMISHIQNKG